MAEDKTAVHSIKDLLGEAQKKNAAYLIVISARSPASVGRMIKLEKGELVMGRSPELALQVDDDGISRRHCKIAQAANGHFQLVDLGSTNGTYLNGIKVNVATLQDGDKIQIGANTVVKFSIQDQLEEEYQRSIYESATRDGLTRIFNKKYFIDTLRKEFAYCLRHRSRVEVLVSVVGAALLLADRPLHVGVGPRGEQRGDPHPVRRHLVAQRVGETTQTPF